MEALLDTLAPLATTPAAPSTRTRWVGWLITALPVLFLLFDGTIKLAQIPAVSEAFVRMGLPHCLASTIGVLELSCLALYLMPRTAPLGAILLTGFLGGAISLHVRIGDPLFSHTFFPLYMGIPLWIGLYLRDARVRGLITAGR